MRLVLVFLIYMLYICIITLYDIAFEKVVEGTRLACKFYSSSLCLLLCPFLVFHMSLVTIMQKMGFFVKQIFI